MPYITQARRKAIDDGFDPETAGELNYAFTVLALKYFKKRFKYQAANDVVGALEGAKLEFYRRVVASYEDQKIAENGDIWP